MNLFGLNLYEEDAFTGKETYGNRYEQNRIIDFFELLEVESGSTNPFTKAKGFSMLIFVPSSVSAWQLLAI